MQSYWNIKDQYGASAYGIAFATGWSVAEAEKFIENERKMFPDVEVFFDTVAESIESTRKYKRVQLDNGSYSMYYTGYYKSPSGFEYAYRTQKRKRWDRGKAYEVDEFKPTEMRNYIIQGDSSFFVQVVTGKLIRKYFRENFYDGKLFPINTVHDQVLLDVHLSVLEEVVRDTIPIMEAIPRWMKPLGYELKLPYPVEATAGMNWQDQKPMSEFGINL